MIRIHRDIHERVTIPLGEFRRRLGLKGRGVPRIELREKDETGKYRVVAMTKWESYPCVVLHFYSTEYEEKKSR